MKQKKKEMETAKSENEKFDEQQMYEIYYNNIKKYRDGLLVAFNQKDGLESSFQNGQFILAYYGAERKTDLIIQNGVEDVVLDRSYSLDSNPGTVLLKYLVHLKTQQAYARNEHDMAAVELLEQWFARFEEALKVLLDNESIVLRYEIGRASCRERV